MEGASILYRHVRLAAQIMQISDLYYLEIPQSSDTYALPVIRYHTDTTTSQLEEMEANEEKKKLLIMHAGFQDHHTEWMEHL